VIGKPADDSINRLKALASANVEFTGFVPEETLIEWCQRAKAVCQLSYHEAFSVSLGEAMACGCIPLPRTAGHCLKSPETADFIQNTKTRKVLQRPSKSIKIEQA